MESDIWISEHGRLVDGDCAYTGSGRLPCKHVLHTVGPVWRCGEEDEEGVLRAAVLNTLTRCEELKAKSVSFPAISSGIFNFPKPLCAEIMWDTCLKYAESNEGKTCVNLIRFTNFDDDTVSYFMTVFNNMMTKGGPIGVPSSLKPPVTAPPLTKPAASPEVTTTTSVPTLSPPHPSNTSLASQKSSSSSSSSSASQISDPSPVSQSEKQPEHAQPSVKKGFGVGEACYAKWNDGLIYLAKVTELLPVESQSDSIPGDTRVRFEGYGNQIVCFNKDLYPPS